jgi:hypothetical protein
MSVKRVAPLSVVTQLTMSGGVQLPPIAFYEVLEITLLEMEAKREMQINWIGEGVLNPVFHFHSLSNIGIYYHFNFSTRNVSRSDRSA